MLLNELSEEFRANQLFVYKCGFVEYQYKATYLPFTIQRQGQMETTNDILPVIFQRIKGFDRFVVIDKIQSSFHNIKPYLSMQQKENKNIEEATERVKKRIPLEELRRIPKYKDLTQEEYEKLIKDAETFALLILSAFSSEK